MLKHIDLPDLSPFTQPAWNDERSLSAAFDAILDANDEESSWSAYHDLLFAIGNDHAGTYCSVVLGVLPAMERVVREGGPWSKHAVLHALTDLYCSFEPEMDQEMYGGQSLRAALGNAIVALRPVVETLVDDEGVVGKSARELIATLDEIGPLLP